MMIIKHTIGTRAQEEIITKLAGVIEDYAAETAGPDEYTDEILIMGVVRRTLRRILPRPLKDFQDVKDPVSDVLLEQCVDDLTDYFNLSDHRDAILETCHVILNEWKKRIIHGEKTPRMQGEAIAW